MEAISGPDGRDSTALQERCPDLSSDAGGRMAGISFGVPREIEGWDLDPAVRRSIEEAAEAIAASGGRVDRVDLPPMEESIACYYVIANAEASSNLARFDGVRYGARAESDSLAALYTDTRTAGFGEEVKRRILLGTFVLSAGYYDAYYRKAVAVRRKINRRYSDIFSRTDILLLPTTPGPAFRLGEKLDDPVSMYLSDIFTTSANVVGIPAISVPSGLSEEGLPLGIQVMAAPGREDVLLTGARWLERHFQFRERYIPCTGGRT
jgi:aspartyl-tRNA(Asn)/glutamyl-tRNA(Gln) amidotransferase subunit A